MSQFWDFSATGNGLVQTIEAQYWTAQMLATCSAGNVQATVVIEATNTPSDSGSWQTLDTLTNVAGASPQRDFGFGGPIGWKHIRARCTALSGTDANVRVVANSQ